MQHFVDGEAELYLDETLAPILICTWIGGATLDLVAKFHVWGDEKIGAAKAAGRTLIMINDGTAADRPSADVRRAMAEKPFDREVVVANYIALSNPLVRGALTAIGWIMGESFDAVVRPTLPEVVEMAVSHAARAGMQVPSEAKVARYLARAAARSA